MKIKDILFEWDKKFPAVCGHTSILFLKSRDEFPSAKRGDSAAAARVVAQCVKPQRLTALRRHYPKAELLPVVTDNQLPIALAQSVGLKVCRNIHKSGGCQRKKMNAMERLLFRPVFTGAVKRKTSYIIVDDIVTQGGTVSALRKHIVKGGGRVVAVIALAYAPGSERLSPTAENIRLLENKFGQKAICAVLQKYCSLANLRELTNQQIRYLLRFNDIFGIVKKIKNTLLQINRSD